jgi:hypothetical protein
MPPPSLNCTALKKAGLPLLVGLMVLSGCASHYVLKLTNGTEITTETKPRLEDGSWRFKDAAGEEVYVPSGRVLQVTPASSAAREPQPQGVQGGPPKKRHWYFLWLA